MKKFIFVLPLLCLLCCSSPVYARVEDEIEDTWISEDIQQACVDYGKQRTSRCGKRGLQRTYADFLEMAPRQNEASRCFRYI